MSPPYVLLTQASLQGKDLGQSCVACYILSPWQSSKLVNIQLLKRVFGTSNNDVQRHAIPHSAEVLPGSHGHHPKRLPWQRKVCIQLFEWLSRHGPAESDFVDVHIKTWIDLKCEVQLEACMPTFAHDFTLERPFLKCLSVFFQLVKNPSTCHALHHFLSSHSD